MAAIPKRKTGMCEICGTKRTGEYSHSSEYFHFYKCPQKAPNGESHSFHVATTLGKLRAGLLYGGMLSGGAIATKKGIDAIKDKVSNTDPEAKHALNGDLINETIEASTEGTEVLSGGGSGFFSGVSGFFDDIIDAIF